MFRINRYLTKMIVFSIGVSTLPIILLGLFFYVKTSSTIQQKVNDGNVLVLEQTRLRIEQVLGALDLQIERLSESTFVTEALETGITPSHFTLVQNLLRSMSQVQTFDVGVRDVHLIDVSRGGILNSEGYNPLTPEKASVIDHYLHIDRNKFWNVEKESLLRSRNADNSLTFSLVKKVPAFTEKPLGMLIVEINGGQLRHFLAKNNTLGEVMILDEDYSVLATQSENRLVDTATLQTIIGNLRGNEEKSGLFESLVGDTQVGVAFQRSSFNGWIYMSLIPIEQIRFESRRTGWIILATCVTMLMLAVLISWAGSQRMYAPIQRLYLSLFSQQDPQRKRVDEFSMINEGFMKMRSDQVQMADQLRSHTRQLEEYYVLKLVRGDFKPSEINEKLGVMNVAGRRMAVLTIQMDTLKGTRYEERDSELLLFAINNMVSDLIPSAQRLLPIVLQSSQVTLVFEEPGATEDFRTYIYSLAKNVQDTLEQYLKLRISIGISRSYDGLRYANQAYKEAIDALKYRVMYGQKTILHIDDVQPVHNVTTVYPKELERQIRDSVKMADRDKAQELLNEFFEEISRQYLNYNEYQIAVTRFFVNLIWLLQESGSATIDIPEGEPPLLEQLNALSSVDEVRHWFRSKVIEPIIRVYDEQRRTRHKSISEEVTQLIHSNFDSEISLESCSTLLNYHPSYISKVLRQELGISFSDYLLQYRLLKAKEMLEETDMKVSEIAHKLQYNNSQNFIRSFRKLVGITPGAYREDRHNNMQYQTHKS